MGSFRKHLQQNIIYNKDCSKISMNLMFSYIYFYNKLVLDFIQVYVNICSQNRVELRSFFQFIPNYGKIARNKSILAANKQDIDADQSQLEGLRTFSRSFHINNIIKLSLQGLLCFLKYVLFHRKIVFQADIASYLKRPHCQIVELPKDCGFGWRQLESFNGPSIGQLERI